MCTIDLTVDTTKITILKALISYNYAPTRTVQVIRVRGVSLAFGVATFVNLDSYLSRKCVIFLELKVFLKTVTT